MLTIVLRYACKLASSSYHRHLHIFCISFIIHKHPPQQTLSTTTSIVTHLVHIMITAVFCCYVCAQVNHFEALPDELLLLLLRGTLAVDPSFLAAFLLQGMEIDGGRYEDIHLFLTGWLGKSRPLSGNIAFPGCSDHLLRHSKKKPSEGPEMCAQLSAWAQITEHQVRARLHCVWHACMQCIFCL